ncbi:MAG: cytochrome b/b6 domain-containing protein [Candidatus Krumholzibacteriia bacterium]
MILRFRRSERFVHWAIAIPFLVCYTTALILVVFYNPNPLRPFRDVFSWIHRTSGVCFIVFPFLAVLRGRGDVKVHLYNIQQAWIWTLADLKWLALMGLAAIDSRIPLPDQGKFNAPQKLNFMMTMSTYPVFIITGIMIWVPGMSFYPWLVHFFTAALVTPLIVGHIYMATINPGTRKALNGMISGFVDRQWAKHHHRLWYRENFENDHPPQHAVRVRPPQRAVPVVPAPQAVPLASPQPAVPRGTPQYAMPVVMPQQAVPVASPQHAVPVASRQQAVPVASPQHAVPAGSGQRAVPVGSRRHADQVQSSQHVVPDGSPQHAVQVRCPSCRTLHSSTSWAWLLRKIFKEEGPLLCPSCGAELKSVSLITETDVVDSILRHLDATSRPSLHRLAGPGEGQEVGDDRTRRAQRILSPAGAHDAFGTQAPPPAPEVPSRIVIPSERRGEPGFRDAPVWQRGPDPGSREVAPVVHPRDTGFSEGPSRTRAVPGESSRSRRVELHLILR